MSRALLSDRAPSPAHARRDRIAPDGPCLPEPRLRIIAEENISNAGDEDVHSENDE